MPVPAPMVTLLPTVDTTARDAAAAAQATADLAAVADDLGTASVEDVEAFATAAQGATADAAYPAANVVIVDETAFALLSDLTPVLSVHVDEVGAVYFVTADAEPEPE
jgi:hypothetical protein